MTKSWRKQSIIRKQKAKEKQELTTVLSHKERQEFLKTFGLAEILEVDHLLPEVEDWDYYITPPPKNTRTITVKMKYVGRAKSKPYYLEDDE